MPKSSRKTNREAAISVRNCTVSYDGNAVVDDVSFDVPDGSVTAIIGPNGSGKTTLIKAILNLMPMDSGQVRIFGHVIDDARGLIGYVPQRLNFDYQFPITVREFMDLARHEHCPKRRIVEKLDEVGLSKKIADSHLGKLSGGQLQRVLIAQAILNEPNLLILDEPSSGIDVAGEHAFYEIIRHLNREHNTTVLMVSHELTVLAETVDHVACLNHRMLYFGPTKKALSSETLSKVFGPHQIFEHPGHR